MQTSFQVVSAAEAASYINDGDVIGFSGFTPAGSTKEARDRATQAVFPVRGKRKLVRANWIYKNLPLHF